MTETTVRILLSLLLFKTKQHFRPRGTKQSLLFPNELRVVVLPLGRGNYVLQEFDLTADPDSKPYVVNEDGLIQIVGTRPGVRFIFHKDLEVAAAKRMPSENFSVSTEPLATLIGRSVLAGRGTEDGRPLYLRNREVAE